MCSILKQNAGRGMTHDWAHIIPQQINIALWIGIRKSLNRNVFIGREKNLLTRIPFFTLDIS
jgi:hypothetical protein